jgi:hypothetical protein
MTDKNQGFNYFDVCDPEKVTAGKPNRNHIDNGDRRGSPGANNLATWSMYVAAPM